MLRSRGQEKTIFQEAGKHKEVLRRKNERPGYIDYLKQKFPGIYTADGEVITAEAFDKLSVK